MTLLPKYLIGALSLIGSAAAIAIPVSLSDDNSSLPARVEGKDQLIPVSVQRCSEIIQKNKVNFGSVEIDNICGTAPEDVSDQDKISDLLNVVGSKNNSWSSLNDGTISTYCIKKEDERQEEGEVGLTLGKSNTEESCDGSEYLRLTKESGEIFLKKKNNISDQSIDDIYFCTQNCGQENASFNNTGSVSQLVRENSNNGKAINFYKR